MAHFAEIILPVALPKATFTYQVPPELSEKIQFGVRVEVDFARTGKHSGIVAELHDRWPDEILKVKPVLSVLDDRPVVSENQLKLWRWMAKYYACTLGEVMAAALPSGLRLGNDTTLCFNEAFGDDFSELSNDEYLIAEALLIRREITIKDVQLILGKKTVLPIIKILLARDVLFLKEELQEKYRPKTVSCVRLAEPFRSDSSLLKDAFAQVERAEKQAEALMAVIHFSKNEAIVRRSQVAEKVGASALAALEKKGIVEFFDREISRLGTYEDELEANKTLSDQQKKAVLEIEKAFLEQKVALLHGVTGSGKTAVYADLIQKTIASGGQVLYLLPEIALTTQMIGRLQKTFGAEVAVYHGKISGAQRVEIWRAAADGAMPIVVGARSSVFLPFSNLRLVIVDEEHDSSFKQNEPSPRYSGRDAAIFLAKTAGAQVILGTATPSVESFQNAKSGKYALVEMPERHGGVQMPAIELVDLRVASRDKKLHGHFSEQLLEAMKTAIGEGEQVILFQNRRGFAPIYQCSDCDWRSDCRNCDIALTYHKTTGKLRCHTCGFGADLPKKCPVCDSAKLVLRGFGTEKIEDDLQILLPEARLARMDLDTASGKTALSRLLNDFEERKIDVLIGTQMVTKGLDFENVGLVGALAADGLLGFPDFRSAERAFQLLTQVAGRAGRKKRQGKVLIQAWAPAHPVLQEVLRGDWPAFFEREMTERRMFDYPPFSRLIHISMKHKKAETVSAAAKTFEMLLRPALGKRLAGPAVPAVPRVRNFFHLDFLVKMERDAGQIEAIKKLILEKSQDLVGESGFSGVGFQIDVDPV